jgi:hypothetical protein
VRLARGGQVIVGVRAAEPGADRDGERPSAVRHRHLEQRVVAHDRHVLRRNPEPGRGGAQRVERRLAGDPQPAAGQRPDHRADRARGAERPAVGRREERRLRRAEQHRPAPHRLARRLQRGHRELGEPPDEHRVHRPRLRDRRHHLDPRLAQRQGHAVAAEHHHPLAAALGEHHHRAADGGHHPVVGHRQARLAQHPREVGGRPVRPVGEHHVRQPAVPHPLEHRDRAGQRAKAVVHPVAEDERPVHVEDEPARVPQPLADLIRRGHGVPSRSAGTPACPPSAPPPAAARPAPAAAAALAAGPGCSA